MKPASELVDSDITAAPGIGLAGDAIGGWKCLQVGELVIAIKNLKEGKKRMRGMNEP